MSSPARGTLALADELSRTSSRGRVLADGLSRTGSGGQALGRALTDGFLRTGSRGGLSQMGYRGLNLADGLSRKASRRRALAEGLSRPLRLNYFLIFYSLDKLFAKVPIIVIIDPPKVKFAPPCKGTTQQSQIKLTSSTTIDKNS